MPRVCLHCHKLVENYAKHLLVCTAIAFQFGPEDSTALPRTCRLCYNEFFPTQKASHSLYCDSCRWTNEALVEKKAIRHENEHIRRNRT